MSRLIGYARVNSQEQMLGSQEAELRDAGCDRVFIDQGDSSRIADRPEWKACFDYLCPGDILVFRALDRIAGSEVIAIEILNELGQRGVSVRSLTESALNVDMSTFTGKAIAGVVAVLAQLRVNVIRESTNRGLADARLQGHVGGRPSVMTEERLRMSVRMSDEGVDHRTIAKTIGVGKSTVTRHLDRIRLADEDETVTQ